MKTDQQFNMPSKGFSMIEVMIALFVLAIGLLGILGMQNHALRSNQSAMAYSQATFLAQDIIERMRANSSVITTYPINFTQAATAATDCAATTCAAAQLMAWDKQQWKAALAATLLDGDGQITVNAVTVPAGSTAHEVIVEVTFTDRSFDISSKGKTNTTSGWTAAADRPVLRWTTHM